MTRIRFEKYSGAGNDFVLVFEQDLQLHAKQRPRFAKNICDRHFGVGADGLVVLESFQGKQDSITGEQSVGWDFYNADGSTAEMCGNAARCAGEFIRQKIDIDIHSVNLLTGAGPVVLDTSGHRIGVTMSWPEVLNRHYKNPYLSSTGPVINTGVPHLVLNVPNIDRGDMLKRMALQVREDVTLGAGGVNITFVKRLDDKNVEAVTFERGVENFTLACGTGAVSAAFLCWMEQSQGDCAYDVKMPGGLLRVEIISAARVVKLFGPAEKIFEGVIDLERFKSWGGMDEEI